MHRVIRATSSGFKMEGPPRHGQLIIEALGLKDSKGEATHGIHEPEDSHEELLTGDDVFTYRSLAAKANYLSIDTPDLMFACQELCRKMSSPTAQAWRRLVRVRKYLKSHPRAV